MGAIVSEWAGEWQAVGRSGDVLWAALDRHQHLRLGGELRLTVLAGEPGAAGELWRRWLAHGGRVLAAADAAEEAELAKALWGAAPRVVVRAAALAWAAAMVGESVGELGGRLGRLGGRDRDALGRRLLAAGDDPGVARLCCWLLLEEGELDVVDRARAAALLLGARAPGLLVAAGDSVERLERAAAACLALAARVPALPVALCVAPEVAATLGASSRALAAVREGLVWVPSPAAARGAGAAQRSPSMAGRGDGNGAVGGEQAGVSSFAAIRGDSPAAAGREPAGVPSAASELPVPYSASGSADGAAASREPAGVPAFVAKDDLSAASGLPPSSSALRSDSSAATIPEPAAMPDSSARSPGHEPQAVHAAAAAAVGAALERATAAWEQALQAPEAVDEARSAAERLLFEALEAHGDTRGEFRLNQRLAVRFGRRPAEVDLLARRLRVALEVDGPFHFLGADRYRRDRRKDVLLQQTGHMVVRCLAADVVYRLDEVLKMVVEVVRERRTKVGTRS